MSLLSYPSFSWRERLIIKTTEDKILNINNIERGKVLHDILSEIDNINDYNEKISNALKNKKINNNDFKLLQELFKNKNFIKFFNPEFKSYNEIEILSDKGNIYRLDRVVETDNLVYVLDYKTGKINKEDHTKYLKKLELYMSLLESIYNKSIKGYLVYIDINQIIND
jgi:ATP-dependent exoDNAse (exonuclease V) beta subunit